ncbi:MAG: hypothetical protein EBX41_01060 [Chitinophagia bacterium]|nr:hypothetical protein [Chitinophagia bacterium]
MLLKKLFFSRVTKVRDMPVSQKLFFSTFMLFAYCAFTGEYILGKKSNKSSYLWQSVCHK